MSKLADLHAICESVMEFALVEQMLAAKKQLAGAQSDKDKDFYTNRCDGLPRDGVLRSLDRQIDALGDVLYLPTPRLRLAGNLTPAEIKIVEGITK